MAIYFLAADALPPLSGIAAVCRRCVCIRGGLQANGNLWKNNRHDRRRAELSDGAFSVLSFRLSRTARGH